MNTKRLLYRGKCKDLNKWTEGYLMGFNDEGVEEFIISPDFAQFGICKSAFVKKETIGQCTGKQDKDKVKVFEGDIIDFEGDKYEVAWVEEYLGYAIFLKGEKLSYENGNNHFKYYGDEDNIKEAYFLSWLDPYEFKVIGNIYDNPNW